MDSSVKLFLGIGSVGLIAIGIFAFFLVKAGNAPGKYDQFAACLSEKGATFYGAFWCPHCQKVKAQFGNSMKKIKYVECSTQDGKGQLPVCKDKKIEGYPTWIFADDTREVGEVPFETLATKTGCVLPQ
ncbi:MAG: thioredoxin domain-containing protein [Patescibacteria group bacterium]